MCDQADSHIHKKNGRTYLLIDITENETLAEMFNRINEDVSEYSEGAGNLLMPSESRTYEVFDDLRREAVLRGLIE